MQTTKYIMIPGFIEDERSWQPLMEALGKENCCVIPTPGFGNEPELSILTQETYNDYFESKLKKFGLGNSKKVFIGHSFGAILLLGLINKIKFENSRFVLMSCPYSSKQLRTDASLILTTLSKLPVKLIDIQQDILASDKAIVDLPYNFFRYFLDKDLVSEDDIYGYNLMRDQFSRASITSMQQSASILTNFDYEEQINFTKQKLLIIQGGEDTRVDVEKLKKFRTTNQNVKVKWVKGMTHTGFIIEAKKLAKLIKARP